MVRRILRYALPFVLALLGSAAFAQNYTTSTPYHCPNVGCNGVPLDQGGHWQFLESNKAFSLYQIDPVTLEIVFGMYGNPGNLSTYYPPCSTPGSCDGDQPGGMYNVVDNVPQPPNLYQDGSTGPVGQLTFDYEALSSQDSTVHYFGHVVVDGYRVRHFAHSPRGSGGFYTTFTVQDAQIYIDSTVGGASVADGPTQCPRAIPNCVPKLPAISSLYRCGADRRECLK